MGARLSLTLTVLLLGASLFAQSAPPSVPAPNRQWLAGSWTLDKSGPPEDTKSWDRFPYTKGYQPSVPCPDLNPRRGVDGITLPAEPCRTASAPGPGEVRPVNYEAPKIYSVRNFGLKLMVASEAIDVMLERGAVIVDDDFREPTRYATDKPSTIQIMMSKAYKSPEGLSFPAKWMKVRVITSWTGDTIVQELRTRDLQEVVKIRRTFTPFDDGRKMRLVIRVLEPKLKEPVKDIERVYVRSSVPGPGSSRER